MYQAAGVAGSTPFPTRAPSGAAAPAYGAPAYNPAGYGAGAVNGGIPAPVKGTGMAGPTGMANGFGAGAGMPPYSAGAGGMGPLPTGFGTAGGAALPSMNGAANGGLPTMNGSAGGAHGSLGNMQLLGGAGGASGLFPPMNFKFTCDPTPQAQQPSQMQQPQMPMMPQHPVQQPQQPQQPQGPPAQQNGPTEPFPPGSKVEVWSNSNKVWCPGTVDKVEGPMMFVAFTVPTNGANGTKEIPAGHPELRLVPGLPPPASTVANMASSLMPAANNASFGSFVPQAPLPAGWESTLDPSSGDPYFFNRQTGEVTWDRPTASKNSQPVNTQAGAGQGPAAGPSTNGHMPNGHGHGGIYGAPTGAGGIFGGPKPAHTLGVLVDQQEDVVEVSTGRKRIARLSMAAVHGANPAEFLAGQNEHGGDEFNAGEHGGTCSESTPWQEGHPQASQIAKVIVQQAIIMGRGISQEPGDVFNREWKGPPGIDPILFLFNDGNIQSVSNSMEHLAVEVQQILASQPTLVQAEAPVKVFGDIHGQLRDMLLLLHHYGFPRGQRGPTYVFNGDWADRGHHQLEVIALVLALKAVFPDRVFLVRGNHEDAVQNQAMGAAGFEAHCMDRVNHRVFQAIQACFNWLPLGCVISNKILVVHGGIGDGQWTLHDLANVRRPLAHDDLPRNRMVYNILWSDPIPDDPGQETCGVHDSPRDGHAHMMVTFGRDVTEDFCRRNGIEAVVRSHQALLRGFGYDVMHGGHCIRVFSARDYEGSGNDGCVLSINWSSEGGRPHLLVRPQVVRSLACPKADG
eukprot:TRINITY_DN11876_c0_g1_i2.p1 TRINITY_DN11876_c0_g1~~TRINITY_DN11876_c0_g1_i2.p1  ORF type:complete len:795 (+),score=158.55 TRINITY_DN11876_c0_g1_i2:53-2437(+)